MKPYTINNTSEFYFCTHTIVGWQYVFTSPEMFHVIIDSWRYCSANKGIRVHGYVIMPNHVYAILSAEKSNLSDILRDFKRFTSEKISEGTESARLKRYFVAAGKRAGKGNTHKIWASGNHAEAIISQSFFLEKLNYIHENPVRKGYVRQPEHWLYSSARNYFMNDDSVLKIDKLE